ncbi:AmmeMemoRadiSam system protein A [Alkaliphilus peptidifermentans]|uniref:Uncharacterized protein, PH0010 family/AmmeMemoRadiSam system protein A/AmmeMemoRadiSam system protein B n=1 Tax=Alkaliphilus peptidifermentans DSM 18978 TaxID=1120976 RepID=A0A1G5JMU6_9FIRM|nr:AmmeMemoRadiSam system protein A [Alkaliphilus peptidifermentans]SCY89484.1 uncharacterized protein, PH0010 family/AmmeMemoRadiSam system protein A/AmmeMemoRadiSam system protein B [Alkaliphilus peptidifermentans DSM 18978]
MGFLSGIVVTPHPPIIIPEIGGGQEREAEKTIEGLKLIATAIKDKHPEVIICITPHGNGFSDGICVLHEDEVHGSLGAFGRPDIKMSKFIDLDFIEEMIDIFVEEDVPSIFLNESYAKEYNIKVELDHGVIVPLYYIDKEYKEYKIVHITVGDLKLLELYKIGSLIKDAIDRSMKKALILISGDLSHCLSKDGPYEYHPMGKVFDDKLVTLIKNMDIEGILDIPGDVYGPAGECGLKPIAMGLGATDGYEVEGRVVSYEGPFGVGYMNAILEIKDEKKTSLLEKLNINKNELYEIKKRSENIYVSLARAAVEEWVHSQHYLDWETYQDLILQGDIVEELEHKRAGAFVSLHNNGQLRGCIGTIGPTKDNIAEEIIYNAIQAASEDTRFYPIRNSELEDLEIKVDVLHEIEDIKGLDELDVKKYGVIVEADGKRGLLLPNLEGIDTVAEQVEIAKQKANINESEKIKLYRFKVTRHQ